MNSMEATEESWATKPNLAEPSRTQIDPGGRENLLEPFRTFKNPLYASKTFQNQSNNARVYRGQGMDRRASGRLDSRCEIELQPAHCDVHSPVVVHEAQHVVLGTALACDARALEAWVKAVIHQELPQCGVLCLRAAALQTHGNEEEVLERKQHDNLLNISTHGDV